ncbi:MAG: hypothetical protein HRJ53_19325 [Acidobacteria bacterium Pan2503]|uniref:Uncharacterized protein n=1 Tax=Candidatus Acidiferrum panamense TaxID=2741543 RepID=A0A7V8NTL8_9BACT|nr:hypothetical protein [Candidatus Acidoferrum panamensis]
MIIGAEKQEDTKKLVRLEISFDPETCELAITNENAKNCAQIQMILDEAVRMMADTRQQLLAQEQFKRNAEVMREQVMRANLMNQASGIGAKRN